MRLSLLGITGGLIVAGMLCTIGCDREIPSKDPVRSLPDGPPTPFNLTSQINDRTITLSWEVSDSSEVARFRIYRASDTASAFSLFDSTTSLSEVITGLPFDRAVWLRVTSVSSSRMESGASDELSVRAGLLALTIENNDEFTNRRDVQLTVDVPSSAAFIELGEDSALAGATLQTFRTSLSFELSDGDELKTIYARITFDDGLEAGEIISDDIILDTEARLDSVYYSPSGQTFSAGDSIYFAVAAHGETGGEASVEFAGVAAIRLRDNGIDGDATADDGFYAKLYIVPVGLTVVDGEVSGAFTDAAGNSAVAAQAANLLNIQTATPPAPITLAVGMVDTTTAHLTWTRSPDNDFASYRIYRSVSSGISVADDFLTITIITDQNTLSHDDFLSGAGTYYYRVFVFDTEGLTSGSNEVVVTR